MTVASTAVTPVVDYEPAINDADSTPPPVAPRQPRRLSVVPPPVITPASRQFRDAATFADAALRTVLEVIDQRRPPTQLRSLMCPGLADSVMAHTRANPTRRAAAVLRRTRVQACNRAEHSFEVAATYSRQDRLHAIACRVERVETGRWQIVALHIG